MTINSEDVRRFAALAALDVQDGELDQLVTDMENILSFVSQLADDQTEPFRPGPNTTPLRPDVPDEKRTLPDGSGLSSEARDGFIVVPRLPGVDGG